MQRITFWVGKRFKGLAGEYGIPCADFPPAPLDGRIRAALRGAGAM